MAHFLGDVSGSRGSASRLGTKKSGVKARLMSWSGMLVLELDHNELTGKDTFSLWQHKHPSTSAGIDGAEPIAEGIIGQPTRKPQPRPGLIGELTTALKNVGVLTTEGYCFCRDEDKTHNDDCLAARNAIKKAEG